MNKNKIEPNPATGQQLKKEMPTISKGEEEDPSLQNLVVPEQVEDKQDLLPD